MWQVATILDSIPFNSVQSLSQVRLFATPWTAAHQASLSITVSRSLLKLMSIASSVHGIFQARVLEWGECQQ